MPSRFPGIDPYIEGAGLWPDFHHEFITAWRGALRRSLPKHYEARINEELPLPLDEEEVRESWIEIYHRPDRSLVAVLELLSPTNKRGETRSKYLAKRRSLLRQRVHLVELDLLFAGGRIAPPYEYPAADFTALVARAERPGICEVYSWNLRDRLPPLGIPLKPPDADAAVDLQEVFDYAFDQGGYAETVDYEHPPSVPLSEADLKWAARRARSKSA